MNTWPYHRQTMSDQLIASTTNPELYEQNEVKIPVPTEQAFEITSWLVTLDMMSRLSGNIPRSADNVDIIGLCDDLKAGRYRSFLTKIRSAGKDKESDNGLREELLDSPFFDGRDPNDRTRSLADHNLVLAVRLYQQDDKTIEIANTAGVGPLLNYVEDMSAFFAKELISAFEPGQTSTGNKQPIPRLNLRSMLVHKHGQAGFFLRQYYQEDSEAAA